MSDWDFLLGFATGMLVCSVLSGLGVGGYCLRKFCHQKKLLKLKELAERGAEEIMKSSETETDAGNSPIAERSESHKSDRQEVPMGISTSTLDRSGRVNRSMMSAGADEYAGLVNDLLVHMWPEISDIVITILRETVQPKLQASVPPALSGIHFDDIKCHLGDRPVQMYKLKTKVDIRKSKEHGYFKCIRIVGDVMLNSDCEIEIKAPTIGGMMDLTAGVSQVKIHGRIVIELYQLVSKLPLISGLRIYFANEPMIDCSMTGNLSDVLNFSLIKNKILDVVTHVINSNLVLPARIAVPIADVNVVTMQSPRPEGMMRVVMLQTSGLVFDQGGWMDSFIPQKTVASHSNRSLNIGQAFSSSIANNMPCMSTLVYFVFRFGNERFQTNPEDANANSWSSDNVLDLTVHDRHSQWLKVSVYKCKDVISRSFAFDDTLLGECRIPVKGLLNESHGSSGSWWPLEAKTPFEKLESSLPRPAEEVLAGMADVPCIKLDAEWRGFVRKPEMLLESRGWTYKRRSDSLEKDVAAILIVSVYTVSDLPGRDANYWCTVTCNSTPPMTFRGNATSTDETQMTSRVDAEKDRHSPVDEGDIPKSIRSRTFFQVLAATLAVDVNESFTFHLHTPDSDSAKVTLTIHEEAAGGAECNLGSVEYALADVLAQDGLQKRIRHSYLTRRELANSNDPTPFCDVSLKIWLLDDSTQPEFTSSRFSL